MGALGWARRAGEASNLAAFRRDVLEVCRSVAHYDSADRSEVSGIGYGFDVGIEPTAPPMNAYTDFLSRRGPGVSP